MGVFSSLVLHFPRLSLLSNRRLHIASSHGTDMHTTQFAAEVHSLRGDVYQSIGVAHHKVP